MSDKAIEPIVSRIIRLNNLVIGKSKQGQLHELGAAGRDGLLDALFSLYEECNNIQMKKNAHVAIFIEKYQSIINTIKNLRVSVNDFEVKKVIGRGNFGEVQVVREKATGDVYAMKVLRKAETLQHQCVAFYEEERDIMAKSTSPWITKLQYAFQDPQNLYLIMEFHPGGDMLCLLEKYNVLSEEMSSFYLAELVLAIHSVHTMGYAHRDIKPDNILIDRTGHIKLADFGSSSKLNSSKMVTSKMPVGTPDYIAPEVLTSVNGNQKSTKTYGTECDWWSLGIVAYEMLFGVTPFANEKLLVVYNNIMNFKTSLKFPDDADEISEPFIDLIKKLLVDAGERLGYNELLNHPVFQNVDWNNIRQTAPPYVPTVTSQDDTSNFDDFEQDIRPTLGDLQSKKDFSGKSLPFIGFTYTSTSGVSAERLSNLDNSVNSPSLHCSDSDSLTKKKQFTELQRNVSELKALNENLTEEVQKLQTTGKKKDKRINMFENEMCRLENEITSLRSQNKELMRLLQLEREDRVITEKKASQILRCMKRRKSRKEFLGPYFEPIDTARDKLDAGPISEQLDEALFQLDESAEERAFQRATSVSPRHSRSKSPRNVSEELSSVLRESEKKISALEKDLKNLQDENITASIKAERLEDENNRLLKDAEQMQKQDEEAAVHIKALKDAIVVLETELSGSKSDNWKRNQAHERGDSEACNSDLKHENHRLLERINELEKEKVKSKAEREQLKKTLGNLTQNTKCSHCQNAEKKDTKIQKGNITALTMLNEELEEENYKLTEKISELESENEAAVTQIEALKSKVKKLEKEYVAPMFIHSEDEFKDKYEQASEDIMHLKDELEEKDRIIDDLKRKMSSTNSTIDLERTTQDSGCFLELKEELNEKCHIIDDLRNELAVLQETCIASEQAIEIMEENAALTKKEYESNLKTVKEKYDAELKTLKEKLLSFEKTNDEIIQEMEELKMKLQLSEDKLSEYEREKLERSVLLDTQRDEKSEKQDTPKNEEGTKSVKELQAKFQSLKENVNPEVTVKKGAIKLTKENEELSDLKLDLRIAVREKKQAEESLNRYQDRNHQLREKIAALEKQLYEKSKTEEDLKTKNENLQRDVSFSKRDISEKIKMYEAHKDTNEICVKSQGQYQEIVKQQQKLQTEYSTKDAENLRLSSDIENLRKDLTTKTQECAKLQSAFNGLKSTCTEQEQQLQQFEALVEACEEDLKHMKQENLKLKAQIKNLQNASKSEKSNNMQKEVEREELEKQVEELEIELENMQSVHEAEMQAVQEQLKQQREAYYELESQLMECEKELAAHNQEDKLKERQNLSLEEELIQIKEESSRLITQVSSLKASNLKLTQSLETAQENQQETENIIDQLQNQMESDNAKFAHEKLKLQETISQQTKLIDFLQTKAEAMEKRKKVLGLPKIFTKRDIQAGPSLSLGRDNDALEREKTKYRRLQDQLSQARAEIMTLRREMSQPVPKTPKTDRCKSSIPISPISRAMHSALTCSPSPADAPDGNLLCTKESASKFSKLQGMKHRIPHRFTDILCMRGSKCAACLDSVHFGRPASKCQECFVVCHTKCASSLPSTCGLPTGFVQHFRSAVNKNPSLQVLPESQPKLEGWIKIPKSNKQGWERRYIRIRDSKMFFFEDFDDNDDEKAVDCLDFSTNDGEVVVISAVSATELRNAAKSDLPYVLKIEYRPFTTCWPPRSLYLMAPNFAEKQLWVSSLESLQENYKTEINADNKLKGQCILTLKGDKYMDVLCLFTLSENILLLGAMEGLFLTEMSELLTAKLKYKVEGIDDVYQMASIRDIGILILISGSQRNVNMIKLNTLTEWTQNPSCPPCIEMDVVSGAEGCHLFSVQEANHSSSPYLCCASVDTITLFKWNDGAFSKKRIITTKEPCSCIHFTPNSMIYGTDKFYELDLKTFDVEEYLDCTDASLACIVYGVSQCRSYPISIFHVAPMNQPEEYLVCFHELGVFVDGFGQRTRPDDMKWSRLPLAFAYKSPYLFVIHFTSMEVIEILPQGSSDRGIRSVMSVSNPQYLGPSSTSGAIYIASRRDELVEILFIEGTSARCASSNIDPSCAPVTSSSRSPSCASKESGSDGLDFSFSNSLIQSLDSPSGEQLFLPSDCTV